MNTSFSRLRKSISLLSIGALLSTLVVVSPVSAALPAEFAAWGPEAVVAADAYLDADKQSGAGAMSTKYETAKVLATALELEQVMLNPFPFTDVPEWARGYVGALVTDGVVSGATATVFASMPTVTRAELVVMLDRAGLLEGGTMTLTAAQEAEVMAAPAFAQAAFRKALAKGTVMQVRATDGAAKLEVALMVYRATDGAGAMETPSTDGGSNGGSSFDENGGTEGSIEEVDLGSRDETEALEGEEEVEIYAIDIELDDEGQLQLQRLDVVFGASLGHADGGTKPWEYYEEVSVAVDGDIVATMETSSASDWSDKLTGNLTGDDDDIDATADQATDDDTDPLTPDVDDETDAADSDGSDNEYRLRFTGLEATLVSDDTTVVSVLVTVNDSLDSDDKQTVWFINATEARVMDETGVVTTEDLEDPSLGGNDLEESFDLDDEETAELDFSESNDSPEATVLEVSESSDTNEVVVYAFEVEETEGIDATVEELTATFTTTGTTSENDVIKNAHLRVVGEDDYLATETVPNGGAVVFENLGLEVAGDETVELEVVVDFKDNNDGARYIEGTTVDVSIDALTEATDANDNDEDDIVVNGLALPSETHELRSSGLMLEFVSASSTKTNSDTLAVNETVEFTLTFKGTAFGDDIYVDKTCIVGTTGTDVDQVEVSLDGDADGTSTTCTDFDSTGDEEANSFEVLENQTETFTLTVLGNGGEAGTAGNSVTFRARLNGVGYKVGADGQGDTVYAFDLTDYKSAAVSVFDR